MIEDRIGELRMRIRTDLADAAEVGPVVERVVRAVLERCAALMEERAPGRMIMIRRLPLRWRIDQSVLDDATQVEELARATADAIERIAVPSSLDPPATRDGAVVFDDESHLRASHLLARARGRPAWFHAALEEPAAGDPLAALAALERRATAHATLLRLAGAGVLAEVLAVQSSPALAALAAALGCDRLEPLSVPGEYSGTPDGRGAAAELMASASRWPPLAPAARSLALRVHAAALLDTELEAPGAVLLAASVLENIESRQISTVEPTHIVHRAPTVPEDRALTVGTPAAPMPREIDTAAEEPAEATEFLATQCAGLFYLFDRIQELDLAESLWKACLPEGTVLAAAASALLGPAFADDAAPALFGGVEATAKCPEVSLEQHAEIARATCAALAAALPRRGLAEIPPVVVAVVNHPTGRILVAAADGSPFAFFAWPAATPELLRTGVQALLDGWPHRGILAASPALVSLDTSGRLRPRQDAAFAPLFIPKTPTAPAAALLALVAGAPCTLFAARAGAPVPDTLEEFVTRHLARPARIRMRPQHMDIILSADDVDFDARRAGLDRDPGWLPWLQRTVRFVFEEGHSLTNPPITVPAGGFAT
jgi:hypothetical protein